MHRYNQEISNFPGFLFLPQEKSAATLVVVKDLKTFNSWNKFAFHAAHNVYVLINSVHEKEAIIFQQYPDSNAHIIHASSAKEQLKNRIFQEIIILDCSLSIEFFSSLLANDGTLTWVARMDRHFLYHDYFKGASWHHNFTYYLYPENNNVFILSPEEGFLSFPFSLFQTSIISRIKSFFFRKLIRLKSYKYKNVYRLSSYSFHRNTGKNIVFDALCNTRPTDIFIRSGRIAIICVEKQVMKIPLCGASVEAMQKSYEHLRDLNKKKSPALIHVLPKPLECNVSDFPFYERETRCDGVIAAAYTFRFFCIRKILKNSTQLLMEYHLSTRHKTIVDDEIFNNLIGKCIDFLKNNATSVDHGLFDDLKSRLHVRLTGKTIPLVTSHGDYWLGNIIVSQADLGINGIIDWDNSKEGQLPLIDLLHLLTTKHKYITNKYFGKYIQHVLLPKRLIALDKQLIGAYMEKINIDSSLWDVLVISYWLQRCYLWYLIDVNDPGNLNVNEQAWIDASLHAVIKNIVVR